VAAPVRTELASLALDGVAPGIGLGNPRGALVPATERIGHTRGQSHVNQEVHVVGHGARGEQGAELVANDTADVLVETN
jgi:hypothetical protein